MNSESASQIDPGTSFFGLFGLENGAVFADREKDGFQES
jgi:hypothetical protein